MVVALVIVAVFCGFVWGLGMVLILATREPERTIVLPVELADVDIRSLAPGPPVRPPAASADSGKSATPPAKPALWLSVDY